jgi:hypothetical protein
MSPRRSDFRARQDAAVGRADVCECCTGPIDGLDAAARHLCGQCAHKDLGRPYDQLERFCSRVHELEHQLCQVRDAAQELETNPPKSVEVMFQGSAINAILATGGAQLLTYAVRPQKVVGFTKQLNANLDALSDWSSLKEALRSLDDERERSATLKVTRDELLDTICTMVQSDRESGQAMFNTLEATWRAGGRQAVKKLLLEK